MKSLNNNLWNEISVEELESREEYGIIGWITSHCFCVDIHITCWDL